MGLWKHGVEQILAVAGMQNKQTERKTLARQISNKGALCAAHAENQKKGHTFNRFMRRVRERVTENKYSSNWPFQAGATWCKKKGQGNYVTTALRPVMKNGANSTGRRQKAENERFAAYCS